MPKSVRFNEFVATVDYLPDVPLAPHEVLIKDYSENQGMLAALMAAGIVRDTGRRVACGFVELAVVEIVDTDAPVNREIRAGTARAMAQIASAGPGTAWEH